MHNAEVIIDAYNNGIIISVVITKILLSKIFYTINSLIK